ncbi:MAG: hypothetical protein WCL21_19935, partial [Mariniphaga sp.]
MASFTLTYRDIELEGEITHTGVSSIGVQSLVPYAGLRASKHYPFQAEHVPSLAGPRGQDWAAALLTRLYLVGLQIEQQLPHFFGLLSTYRQEAAYYRALQDNVDYQDDCREQVRRRRGRYDMVDHRGSRQHRVDTERCQGL